MTKVNISLLKQALSASQANKRQATTHAKTRSEVSGGGRKPWRQKGTGRARAGSNRSPIWVGGGVTFGPSKERNFKQRLPKKMNKKALLELIKYLNSEKQLIVVPSLSLKSAKTKEALKLLSEHDLNGKTVTFVTKEIEPELVLATRNLSKVTVRPLSQLSLLNLAAGIVLAEEAVAAEWGIAKRAATAPTAAKKATKKAAN